MISAATIEAINHGIEVYGVPDGFKHLVKGNASMLRKLSIDHVKDIHTRGGSYLGTSRTNPTKSPEDMGNVLEVFRKVGIEALVTIGGDDTAYSASEVHRMAEGKVRVAHVPKTIDNDLPLPPGIPTFGFETARHYGVQVSRNLHEDAKTTTPEEVLTWLRSSLEAKTQAFKSPGVGDDVRLEGTSLIGAGLVVDSHPVHVELFPSMPV